MKVILRTPHIVITPDVQSKTMAITVSDGSDSADLIWSEGGDFSDDLRGLLAYTLPSIADRYPYFPVVLNGVYSGRDESVLDYGYQNHGSIGNSPLVGTLDDVMHELESITIFDTFSPDNESILRDGFFMIDLERWNKYSYTSYARYDFMRLRHLPLELGYADHKFDFSPCASGTTIKLSWKNHILWVGLEVDMGNIISVTLLGDSGEIGLFFPHQFFKEGGLPAIISRAWTRNIERKTL